MSKRKFLTLEDRVKVIRLSENGKSGRNIAETLGVGKTQIHGILKRKREIMEEYESNANMEFKRPRRATTYDEVNELCLRFFNDATARKVNVSGPLLKERALQYAKDLNIVDFKASNGWLDSFLKRNNIVFRTMSGERGSVDEGVVTNWKEKLPSLCEGFEPKDIFNMDETGLFYRDSTKSTYFKKGEDCAGGKRSKERITVALCASMTGEKVKPLVIGKSSKPRCFSGLSVDQLPVTYRSNKSAWMTSYLYEEWLRNFDRQMKGRKVLLFVDNAPSHSAITLKNVTVKNFPANTTSMCQPMDQGIIQTLKLKYRQRQLQHVMNIMDSKPGKSGPELLKDISILDAIYWIARSWSQVESSTIDKCFRRCGFSDITAPVTSDTVCECDDEDDDFPIHLHVLARQLFDCDLQQLIDIDKEFVTCDSAACDWNRPVSELLTEIRSENDEHDIEEDSVENESESVCSIIECSDYVEKLRTFARVHGKASMLESVIDIEEILNKMKMESSTKQTKISDFFGNN